MRTEWGEASEEEGTHARGWDADDAHVGHFARRVQLEPQLENHSERSSSSFPDRNKDTRDVDGLRVKSMYAGRPGQRTHLATPRTSQGVGPCQPRPPRPRRARPSHR
jgi:hypothetical protein